PALLATGTTTVAAIPSALACVLAIRFGVAFVERGERADGIKMGVAIGLGLLIQPLDVIAVVAPLALFALVRARGALTLFVRESATSLACVAPLALVWLAVNFATTGRPWQSPTAHYFRRWGAYSLGFGSAPFGLPDH